jgi:hypothetical protein
MTKSTIYSSLVLVSISLLLLIPVKSLQEKRRNSIQADEDLFADSELQETLLDMGKRSSLHTVASTWTQDKSEWIAPRVVVSERHINKKNITKNSKFFLFNRIFMKCDSVNHQTQWLVVQLENRVVDIENLIVQKFVHLIVVFAVSLIIYICG